MNRYAAALCLMAAAAFTLSCDLVNTTGSENVVGRGPLAFDPYSAQKSGAIKLGLQMYKGCATLANGTPVAKGTANIPYPEMCTSFSDDGISVLTGQPVAPAAPVGKLELIAGTTYFLGRLTVVDEAEGLHTDPKDPGAPAQWIKQQSYFNELDWEGLGINSDNYVRSPIGGGEPPLYTREVTYTGANWMNRLNSTFLVEVLDQDGTVRDQQTYLRSDLFAENARTWHTRFQWRTEFVGAPQFPGDLVTHPVDGSIFAPHFRTLARLDMSSSTNPFKTFKVDSTLAGDGAIRVSWSEMPNKPMYFPVSFVAKADVPPTCFGGKDGTDPVPCAYGNAPEIRFSSPQNGAYYQPGETFDVGIYAKDGEGNFLHPPEHLPNWQDYSENKSNGVLYFNLGAAYAYFEADSLTGLKLAGPINTFRPTYSYPSPYTEFGDLGQPSLVPLDSGAEFIPGDNRLPIPTRNSFKVPDDAKPGTYIALLKVHRQFMGERFTKTATQFFQVGQKEVTSYPGRVGNCQICHRGPISLDNVLHGLSVDHIEACKACHSSQTPEPNQLIQAFHAIHFNSQKYPLKKNDCTVCHLTRESALRPSIQVCNTCHPSIHGGKYFQEEFADGVDGRPDRFSNCAQACHVVQVPTQHILPAK